MPKTHPWLLTRAEYVAAHAPSIAPPSTLGVPTEETEELDSQVLDHGTGCQFPHKDKYPWKVAPCTGEVTAYISTKFCNNPPLLVCQSALEYVQRSMATECICVSCLNLHMKHNTSECWAWRLV